MGFWQGVAQAVGEISQENFASREEEKARKAREKERAADRAFRTSEREASEASSRALQMDMLRERARIKQEELITTLRAQRSAQEVLAKNNTNYVQAVAERVADSPDAESFINSLMSNSNAAPELWGKINEIEERLGRPLTPMEITNNLTVINNQGTPRVVDLSGGSLEELMIEQFILENETEADPVIVVQPELRENYGPEDIRMADQAFTSRLVEVAEAEAENLPELERQNLMQMVSEAVDGNEVIQRRLARLYGLQVANSLQQEMQDNPILRPAERSPTYGKFFTEYNQLINLFNSPELDPDLRERLAEKYPWLQ